MNEFIKKIKSKGYWHVTTRPSTYKENRIHSLDRCKEIISSSKVLLRGWDYPHVDPNGLFIAGNNSIHSSCDWAEGPKFEYWKFYQTGQFVHYFSMREDLRISEEKTKEFQNNYDVTTNRFLSIISTLYSVTEIFEFASHIVADGAFNSPFEIIIELGNVKDRMLVFWDEWMRDLYRPYVCDFKNENIKINRVVEKTELIARSSDLALEATLEIFQKFNWNTATKQIFIEDQKKFLERRL